MAAGAPESASKACALPATINAVAVVRSTVGGVVVRTVIYADGATRSNASGAVNAASADIGVGCADRTSE
jgi:hypothetical protein